MPNAVSSEHDRVMMMLEEGKITREEADQLLEALGISEQIKSDMEDVESKVEQATQEARKIHEESQTSENTITEEAKADHKETQTDAEPSRVLSKDLNWLSVDVLAGDINITVDASITEPIVNNGDVTLSKDGNVYRVQRQGKKRKRFNGKLEDLADNIEDVAKDLGDMVVSIFSGLKGDVSVRVPPDFGVEVNSKAGDVDVDNVAYLTANLLAGDLDANNLGGIYLNMAAGDVDVSMKPVSGEHYIKLAVGDLDIKLDKDSSVKVGASVVMGDIDLKGPAELKQTVKNNKTMMGGDFTVMLGNGDASLEIDLNTGDLDVVVPG